MRLWQSTWGGLKRRPWLAGCLLAACLALAGGAGVLIGVQLWASHHWQRALQAVQESDWPAARAHLETCLGVWPRSAETHFLMARVCRRGGDLDSARTHLRRAEELHWITEAVDLEYLLLKAEAGGIGPVDQALRSQLRIGHRDAPLILEALIRGHLLINGLRDAYHYAELWVRSYPDDWQGYFYRGAVLQRLGHSYSHLTLKDYERAVERKPTQPEARFRLAQTLENLGRHAEALPHYQAFQDRYPESIEAAAGRVRCLISLTRLAEATELLDELLLRKPGEAELCFLRGRIALDRDEPEQAVIWLERAQKELGPNSVEFHHTLGGTYRRLGRVEDSDRHAGLAREIEKDLRRVQEITKAVSEDDQNLALRLEAGEILARRGRTEDAGRWVISALRIDPRHAGARAALARLVEQTGDPKLAERTRGLLPARPGTIPDGK